MTRLTESEVSQFEQMRAQAVAGQIGYWQIYEALANLLQTQYGVPPTDSPPHRLARRSQFRELA